MGVGMGQGRSHLILVWMQIKCATDNATLIWELEVQLLFLQKVPHCKDAQAVCFKLSQIPAQYDQLQLMVSCVLQMTCWLKKTNAILCLWPAWWPRPQLLACPWTWRCPGSARAAWTICRQCGCYPLIMWAKLLLTAIDGQSFFSPGIEKWLPPLMQTWKTTRLGTIC